MPSRFSTTCLVCRSGWWLALTPRLHLDELTARLGGELYAHVQRKAHESAAAGEEQRRPRKADGTDSSLCDALFDDGDIDGDGGDDSD